MREGPTPAEIGKRLGEAKLPRQVYYVLAESACPYLPERRERKLITEVGGNDAEHHYSLLSRAGFRRSHNFAYRPACAHCVSCVPVRIDAARFEMSRSLRRVARLNGGLHAAEKPALATMEQYELFNRYIGSRHGDGEMAGMTLCDYRGMVEHSRIDTRMTEFRDADARLVAACLVDWLDDGPSAVYSFFEPALAKRSPGTYVVLWLVEAARAAGLPYVYLGYWIQDAPKMAYKTRFRPLEAFGPGGWRDVEG
jgi:arginine-tRNA-protein transferase